MPSRLKTWNMGTFSVRAESFWSWSILLLLLPGSTGSDWYLLYACVCVSLVYSDLSVHAVSWLFFALFSVVQTAAVLVIKEFFSEGTIRRYHQSSLLFSYCMYCIFLFTCVLRSYIWSPVVLFNTLCRCAVNVLINNTNLSVFVPKKMGLFKFCVVYILFNLLLLQLLVPMQLYTAAMNCTAAASVALKQWYPAALSDELCTLSLRPCPNGLCLNGF